MATIIRILADAGEVCEVDVEELHDKILSHLPAEKYIALFRKMQEKMYGYPAFTAWNAGCGCATVEDKTE